MNPKKLATIPGLAVLLASCGLSLRTHPEDPTAHWSVHTFQELCDFPMQFFSSRYDATNFKLAVGATKPMTDKIDGGNGCEYRDPEGKYAGYVSLSRIVDVEGWHSTAQHAPSRTITVDKVAVSEVVEQVPVITDPPTSRHFYTLTARIDGWEGELGFYENDEQGTQAGAPVLVSMIRTLKGA
ncbi:hypothetical protein ACIBJI_31745 [Nocardia sp. NPDC050408]|uniref:hypothetical protein n=1 Tax=Nocardia sp. NPDC050408 TaxID=3364319 RepID=UPI00379A60C0